MQPSFCQDIYIETGGRITRLPSMTWNNGDTMRSCVHHSTFMEFSRTRPRLFRVTMDRVESKVGPCATIDSVRIEGVRPQETIGKVDRVKRFDLSRLGPGTRSFLCHPSHRTQHVLTRVLDGLDCSQGGALIQIYASSSYSLVAVFGSNCRVAFCW